MKIRFFIFLLLTSLVAVNLNAIELNIKQENFVESGQFDDDYLYHGQNLQFKGKAKDLFFLGEQMDFSGELSLALFAGARTITSSGIVNNGIKAGANTIFIDGTVKGTSFLGGQDVHLGERSHTVGDTFIGARKVILEGPMEGKLFIGAGEIIINNEIQGDVEVYSGQVKILERGRITGNLYYHSDHKLSQEEIDRVSGEIQFDEKQFGFFNDGDQFEDHNGSFWFRVMLKIALAVFGFILLLFPVTKRLEKLPEENRLLSYSLWGLIPVFMYPTLIVFTIILIITIPVALTMLLAFLPLILITKTIGLTMIGGYLARLLGLNTKNRFLFFLFAVIPYSLLSLIPYFGFLLLIFVSATGCGLLLSLLMNRKNSKGF